MANKEFKRYQKMTMNLEDQWAKQEFMNNDKGAWNKMQNGIRNKVNGIKSLFGHGGNADGELCTWTLPRASVVQSEDLLTNCDECCVNPKGRQLTTRLCFRSINMGEDEPILLREIVPCRKCATAEELKVHKFEGSAAEILKLQKKMSLLPKDADFVQEFTKILVEKSPGKCRIISNRHRPMSEGKLEPKA